MFPPPLAVFYMAVFYMAIFYLDQLDDPRLDPYRDLKATHSTRWRGKFIAEGDKLLFRLLDAGYELHSIVAADRFADRIVPRVPAEVPLLVLPGTLADSLAGFRFHYGCLACAVRKPTSTLSDLIPSDRRRLTFVACPDVQNPENLGAIARLCGAFAVDGLLLGGNACDPFSRRVLRVSMGAVLQLPMLIADDLLTPLLRMRDEFGVELCAAVADRSATPLEQAARYDRTCLIFGSEGHGLTATVDELCTSRVTLPMPERIDSLNVAVAAGIFLYHFSRLA